MVCVERQRETSRPPCVSRGCSPEREHRLRWVPVRRSRQQPLTLMRHLPRSCPSNGHGPTSMHLDPPRFYLPGNRWFKLRQSRNERREGGWTRLCPYLKLRCKDLLRSQRRNHQRTLRAREQGSTDCAP